MICSKITFLFMLTLLQSHINIIHRSCPQWVYDYLLPILLVILSLIMLVLLIGFCIIIYKKIWYD